MSWKSVSSCMFLTFRKSKILKYSEKVWVHGHSCSLYIPIRNIQGLTPSHFWHFLAPFVKKCMSLYVSGPLTTDQEHTRTGTFWWKGVSPCMFLANSYRLREYTRTHTFSLNIWWKGVSPCMFLLCIYKGQKYTRSHTFSEKVWVLVCLTIIQIGKVQKNIFLRASFDHCDEFFTLNWNGYESIKSSYL